MLKIGIDIDIDIDGTRFVPLRAVPLMLPGFLSPTDLTDMLCNVEAFGEAPALGAYCVDAKGHPRRMHPMEMHDVDGDVQRAQTSGGTQASIAALPRDIFVRRDELVSRFEFLDAAYADQETRFASRPGTRVMVNSPYLTPTNRELVQQSIDAIKTQLAGPPVPVGRTDLEPEHRHARDVRGNNPAVQAAAVAAAKALREQHGRRPTKKAVVKTVHAQFPNKSVETVQREFNKTW